MASKSTFGANQTTVEIGERLDVLGKQIDRLKVMYEQYFMGIQKIPPSQLHRDCERQIRELTQLQIRNTAQRYRFANLSSKFGSYNTYWKRTMREIESGRYVRDVRRASRRAAAAGMDVPAELLAKMPRRMRERIQRDRDALAKRLEREGVAPDDADAGEVADDTADEAPAVIRNPAPAKGVHQISAEDAALLEGDFDMDELFGSIMAEPKKAPAAAPPPTPAAKPPPRPAAARPPPPARRPAPRPRARARTADPSAPPPPGMSESQARELYKSYVQARKLVGESTDKLSYGKLMNSLNKQAPKIMQQHKAKGVEFNVVVKDDKVILKAKPKR